MNFYSNYHKIRNYKIKILKFTIIQVILKIIKILIKYFKIINRNNLKI